MSGQEAERYAVVNGWLVENVGHHTCGAGTAESGCAHEPGCGWEPIARVEQLMTQPHGIERTLGKRLDALVYRSHLASMNGEPHLENELNELEDRMREWEQR